MNEKESDSEIASLFQAIRENNTKSAQAVINAGVDVNARDQFGKSPLHCTFMYGNLEIVEMLLNAEADVNERDSNGNTLLHDSFLYRTPYIFKSLVDAGAEINVQNEDGRTPLHLAALRNYPEIVKLLVDAGANLELQNKYGRTPLHEASLINNPNIAKTLLDARANAEAQDKEDRTPLHLAARYGTANTIKVLVDAGANLESRNHRGQTPLNYTIFINENINLEIIKALIKAGADVNTKDNAWGFTSLHESDADPDIPDTNGNTPLHYALLLRDCDNTEIITELFAAGADVNARGEYGRTPLYWMAGLCDNLNTFQTFLKKKADVNAKDQYGQTPLDMASICDRPNVEKILRGANPHMIKRITEQAWEKSLLLLGIKK